MPPTIVREVGDCPSMQLPSHRSNQIADSLSGRSLGRTRGLMVDQGRKAKSSMKLPESSSMSQPRNISRFFAFRFEI
jgi:hypothetical protein